jgi:hypothetical protein
MGKLLENIPLQRLSRRRQTMLNMHLGVQDSRTRNEYLVCDVFHKGDIVNAITNFGCHQISKNLFISSITMRFPIYTQYYYY